MSNTINYFNEIKGIQDILRKKGLQKVYQSAILGFTILRRLTQTLEHTSKAVVEEYERMKADNDIDTDLLISVANEKFYNTSGLNFDKLKTDVQNIYANTLKLITSFSSNIYDVLGKDGLGLEDVVKEINEKDILYSIIDRYSQLDFSREHMSNANMGALFGQLVVLLYGTPENGENWTPDDFVKLCTKLLLAEGCDWLKEGSHLINACDHAIGSGQLLSYLDTEIHKINSKCTVQIYGQDNQKLNIAICKAEQLMLGRDIDKLFVADSLKEDKFGNVEMDFSLQNAPYGCGREKKDEKDIKKYLGDDLPGSGDNQMLFWKAMLKKLRKGGRAVYLSNGSPLFSGSTNSGESHIRKWLFENDYVEAIIKLTDQGFLDTGISIYAWVVSKGGKANTRRAGKIQLIDASSFSHPMKKSVGQKRKQMTDMPILDENGNPIELSDIDKIVKLYTDFDSADSNYSIIKEKEDFYYRQVTIQQPYQRNFMISEDRIDNLYEQSTFAKLYDEDKYNELLLKPKNQDVLLEIKKYQDGKVLQEEIINTLKSNLSGKKWINRDKFTEVISNIFADVKYKSLIKNIVAALSEKDKTADTYIKGKGNKAKIEADSELNDNEFIPYKTDVQEYFDEEVKPFLPDSWYLKDYIEEDTGKDVASKVGCEINFNKYFYKYEEPQSTDELLLKLNNLNNAEKLLMDVVLGNKVALSDAEKKHLEVLINEGK